MCAMYEYFYFIPMPKVAKFAINLLTIYKMFSKTHDKSIDNQRYSKLVTIEKLPKV